MQHGLIRATHRRRQRASARRHFRHGQRAAALRAFQLYLNKEVPTLAAAAEACGSNMQYVRAAVVLIQDETSVTQQMVLLGMPLMAAANRARRRRKAERITPAEAVMGWKRWSPEQRAEFGRGAGVAEVWDHAIAPVITEEREVAS
jgi:hypothetical protein